MKKKSKAKSKKPYKPPKVNRVKIRIDEVVLAACKVSGGGVEYATCLTGCVIGGS